MFLFALAFKRDEKASYYEHYPSILVSFVGKQKHQLERRENYFYLSMPAEILVTARRIKIYYLSDSHP